MVWLELRRQTSARFDRLQSQQASVRGNIARRSRAKIRSTFNVGQLDARPGRKLGSRCLIQIATVCLLGSDEQITASWINH